MDFVFGCPTHKPNTRNSNIEQWKMGKFSSESILIFLPDIFVGMRIMHTSFKRKFRKIMELC